MQLQHSAMHASNGPTQHACLCVNVLNEFNFLHTHTHTHMHIHTHEGCVETRISIHLCAQKKKTVPYIIIQKIWDLGSEKGPSEYVFKFHCL